MRILQKVHGKMELKDNVGAGVRTSSEEAACKTSLCCGSAWVGVAALPLALRVPPTCRWVTASHP